jgi:hypothetical protein
VSGRAIHPDTAPPTIDVSASGPNESDELPLMLGTARTATGNCRSSRRSPAALTPRRRITVASSRLAPQRRRQHKPDHRQRPGLRSTADGGSRRLLARTGPGPASRPDRRLIGRSERTVRRYWPPRPTGLQPTVPNRVGGRRGRERSSGRTSIVQAGYSVPCDAPIRPPKLPGRRLVPKAPIGAGMKIATPHPSLDQPLPASRTAASVGCAVRWSRS